MRKLKNFQELATKACDMELTISSHQGKSLHYAESKKDKVEFKKNVKFSKNMTKEVMPISINEPIQITGKPKLEDKKSMSFKHATKKRSTLKEFQGKEHLFPDPDLSGLLDNLIEKGVIGLSEPKSPKKVRRTIDPKYCWYYRVISHPSWKVHDT